MMEVFPRSARIRIAELEAQVAARDARIAELESEVKVLTRRVAELEARLRLNLSGPVAQAEEYVRNQDAANLDEMGWYEGKAGGRHRRAWLWLAATSLVAVFESPPVGAAKWPRRC
jgi:uncharacterized coiled-coil protein SlyX